MATVHGFQKLQAQYPQLEKYLISQDVSLPYNLYF